MEWARCFVAAALVLRKIATPRGTMARRNVWADLLFGDAVDPVPVGAKRGFNGSPHFLSDRGAKGAAETVSLPVRSFHQLSQCDTAGPFQPVEDLGGLAAVARRGAFLGRGASGAAWF